MRPIYCDGYVFSEHADNDKRIATWRNTWQTVSMPAPAFHYACDECKGFLDQWRVGKVTRGLVYTRNEWAAVR